jgi:hypothetical protein
MLYGFNALSLNVDNEIRLKLLLKTLLNPSIYMKVAFLLHCCFFIWGERGAKIK